MDKNNNDEYLKKVREQFLQRVKNWNWEDDPLEKAKPKKYRIPNKYIKKWK